MKEPASADDVRENLKEALSQLETLHKQGRILMTKDTLNTDWPDEKEAYRASITALELVLDATYWMQTLPHTDGGYPPISG